MALVSSGIIKFSDINTELGVAYNTSRKLSDSAVRALFGVASGRIALRDGYGKSNRVPITITIASNTTNYTLNTAAVSGYTAGKTDVTFVVNSGIYLYSTSTATPALTVSAFTAGDTVTIVNSGYIIGMGGDGGHGGGCGTIAGTAGYSGGPAIQLGFNVNITNNSYIAGGGGGGGGTNGVDGVRYGGGGGGAGGGNGGGGGSCFDGSDWVNGGLGLGARGIGGTPGSAGSNATGGACGANPGGGGGRILPGTGAAAPTGGNPGSGGSSGGSGGGWVCYGGTGNGGAGGSAGSNGSIGPGGGGGGGGWGAAGGSSLFAGGSGGKAVNLNGYTVTWLTTGTRYGVIS